MLRRRGRGPFLGDTPLPCSPALMSPPHVYSVWIILSLTFLAAGLAVNLLECLAFLLIRPFSLSLFRRVNAYLCYLHWSIIPCALDRWCHLEVRVFGVEDEVRRFGKSNIITVMNHRGDLDWMIGHVVLERVNILHRTKCLLKSFVKYLPTVGWSFWFSDFVFLKRNFEQDQTYLRAATKEWKSYDFPWLLIVFAEGTRSTEEKHRKSLEYASEKGLPKLKYHLLPRTKGFNLIMREIKDHVTAIGDCTIAYRHVDASLSAFVRGDKMYADLNTDTISDLPVESEEELSAWLINLYKEKDDLVEYHHNHGRFPGDIVDVPRRFLPTAVMTTWILLLVVSFAFYVYTLLVAGAYWTLVILAIIILAAQLGMRLLMQVTVVPKIAAVREKDN